MVQTGSSIQGDPIILINDLVASGLNFETDNEEVNS